MIAPELVTNVDVLCLDAGNVVIFCDHARIAALASAFLGAGVALPADALVRAEGEAKLAQERGEMLDFAWAHESLPGARGWGRMVGTMAVRAGFPEESVAAFVESLWPEHVKKNLYSVVPQGLGAALDEARATGVKVAIVSNSEGMLDRLFADLGVLAHFDAVVDSGKVGVEKPDPRIFRIALDRFGASPDRALMLGDTYATDIVGARAAGMRAALVDPFEHMKGRHLDVPRVPGAVEVARAIAHASRSTLAGRNRSSGATSHGGSGDDSSS